MLLVTAFSVKYLMPRHEKIAYFDCFAGISGDMCLGALVDAGVDLSDIKKGLKKLPIQNYSLASKKVLRGGISATKVDVIMKGSGVKSKTHGGQGSRATKWKDIEKIIKTSQLSEKIKQKGLHIFKKLFEAEARVHGEPFDKVHLHELGGIDCLVDIFGALIGLDILGIEKIYVSSINLGSGSVKTEHGILPVPAPATAELLKGYPVYSSEIPFELTTPTGAAIISGINADPYSLSKITIEKIGYGAGNKDIANMPNTLRILIGKEANAGGSEEFVTVIETNIDDMNPQFYEYVMEMLFKAGAHDVFLENIIMKKGRPAVKLTVISEEGDIEKLSSILFQETTTIGLRFYKAHRRTLDRKIKKIKTKYGDVRIKVSTSKGNIVNISPEYEDLKAIAKKTKIPIKKIAEEIHLQTNSKSQAPNPKHY
ncbi:nickel pincer cofactor biosynthesis protein LarC [Dissulfurispira sp.]|uniref:nickel pincer cofactor biosynthesis protein LarC n=1 Tax=Dissulfurispira sp. TaxID=2817609 RepID=UPI002FDA3EC4